MTHDEHDVLLQMSRQLGRIEAELSNVKEDIKCLRGDVQALQTEDDVQQQALRDAYDRAMEYARKRQDGIKEELMTRINRNSQDIIEIKGKKAQTLTKWYDRLTDKLIWAFLAAALIVLLNWLSLPIEISQLIK